MIARDLMTSEPFVLTPTDTIARAADLMRSLGVGCLPVVDSQQTRVLVGMLTDRDIVVRCVAEQHGTGCVVRAHMTAPPIATVEPDDDASVVVEKMEHAQVRRIPVVDVHDKVVGIIAQADLARKLGPTEAEIVQEVLEKISAPAPAAAIT